jgi:hypothetical protein
MFREKPQWLSLPIVLSILAVLVPIILYIVSLTEKSLQYEIISRSELIGEESPIKDLELKIKGESVKRVIFYTLSISNSGTEPIKKDDFERPISINVADDTKIYLARVKKKLPENLVLKYELNNNKVLIEPLLLNVHDEFQMELFSSSNVSPSIDTRIVGVSKIKIKEKLTDSKETTRNFGIVLSLILVVFYGKYLIVANSQSVYSSNVLIRYGQLTLALVCLAAFTTIIRSIADIENTKTLFFWLFPIPMFLGIFWGFKEVRYNQTMRRTDESGDS